MQVGDRPFNRRPDNSAFKQQRLPAWSPSLSPHTVLPIFYFLSVVCLLLGVWLIIIVQGTHQLKIDYTDDSSCDVCFEVRKYPTNATTNCTCTVNFNISKPFLGDVFFYYGLINFHQNLRRYMDSRDDAQLVGRKTSLKSPSSYCKPFASNKDGVPIAPCGAVANSMFNDSFTFVYNSPRDGAIEVPLIKNGITWYTDKNIKFHNPWSNSTLQQAFNGTAKPLYWQRQVYELGQDPNNNGFVNDNLIVWMREAAFPNFKKLYGILNRTLVPFSHGLPAGNYTVTISYHYPVQYFRGRKEIVFTTVTWFGGQNHFLPIAYLVTGSVIFVMAIILTVVYIKVGRSGKNMELPETKVRHSPKQS